MREPWDAKNAKSINVYGKVIDQYGQPVVGVTVNAGTLLIISFDRSGGEKFSSLTDAHGEFSFTGLHGARFGLGLEKPGYIYDPKTYLDWWDNYKPDPGRPATFIMWKLKGAEPMAHVEAHCGLACDAVPTSFDLLIGSKANAGKDLTVTLTRNPLSIDRSKPFDWTLTLQIATGGLIPVGPSYAYEAPAVGYQPSITVSRSASEKNWSPSLVQTYFFSARNGQVYGRITVNLMANYEPPPTRFEIEIYANPAGSRNLEFDPAKEINY